MASIIPLKDSTGAQFYPQTHEKAVIDSNGVNLQTKLQSISAPSYVVAWDGDSTPVVANIPAGVTLTYSGQTYTGTLAASSSTLNKTYLVGDNNGNFDEYVTQVNGSTYSWQYLGNTEIDLSDYATKDELNQLGQKVGETETEYVRTDVTVSGWTYGKVINYTTGAESSLSNNNASGSVDVSAYAGMKVHYLRLKVTADNPAYGMAFYDSGGTYISGEGAIGSQLAFGYEDSEMTIPDNAATARFTCRNDYLEDFYLYVNVPETTYTSGIGKTVQDMDANYAPLAPKDNVDLAISDEAGEDLAIFSGGHIKTKKFNSALIGEVIGRYIGKKVSILGDSISTYGDPSATNEDGTYCYSYYPAASCRYSEDGVDSIQFDVNDTYWMKLIQKTGMKLGINDSYRGTTVSGTSNAFNLQTRINHLDDNGTPDVILVFGGANDAGASVTVGTFNTEDPSAYTDEQIASLPATTFADAYRTMLIRLMKTYPLAEIIVILPTFTSSYYSITNLDQYVEVIKEACDFFGIKYVDARCTGINVYNKSTYLVDGIHPNAKGMALLYEKLYRQILFT